MEKIYDVLILGGGVAGMSAAVYAKRAGKSVAIIEKFALGGRVLELEKIENFPSQTIIDGATLAGMFSKQVKNLQIEVLRDEISQVDFAGETKLLKGIKSEYQSKKVVVATGIKEKTLGVGEEKLLGQGVSYCATCDGNFYKGKKVCVASNGGSGIADALYLCNIASEVCLVDCADMSVYKNANKNKKLNVISNFQIKKVENSGEKLQIFSEKGEVVDADALFVSYGKTPSTSLFEGVLELDAKGYIVVDENMETSVKNVFAVGDVRNGKLKQIVTACSDGAIAGNFV